MGSLKDKKSFGNKALLVTYINTCLYSYKIHCIFADGPKFIDGPNHVAADVGDAASLTCNVDGNPTATVIWTRQGSLNIISHSDTLTFTSVRDLDFGVYTCTAKVMGFAKEIRQDVHLMRNGEWRMYLSSIFVCMINQL